MFSGGENGKDIVGLAFAEISAKKIGTVAHFLDDLVYRCGGLIGNCGAVVQNTGNGGYGNSRCFGNVLDCYAH